MKLPDKVFGINTQEAYKKYLEDSGKRKPRKTKDPTPSKAVDAGDYVYMPQHKLYVAKRRSHLGENWSQAHKALHQEDARMLTLIEFSDFLKLLKAGNDEFKAIYGDITEVRNPYRAEWLDADFKTAGNKLKINYNHRTINGKLKPKNSELLEDCLMENKTPGISLDYWLSNPTSQGLPRADIGDGSLYYWAPMRDDKSVARFDADSGRAGLGCNGDPADSDSGLGVRAAKIKVK